MLERSNSHCMDYRRRSGACQAAQGQNNQGSSEGDTFPGSEQARCQPGNQLGHLGIPHPRGQEVRCHARTADTASSPKDAPGARRPGPPALPRCNSSPAGKAAVRRSRYPSASRPSGADFSRHKVASATWYYRCRLASATLHYNSVAGCTWYSYKRLQYWPLDCCVSLHPAII